TSNTGSSAESTGICCSTTSASGRSCAKFVTVASSAVASTKVVESSIISTIRSATGVSQLRGVRAASVRPMGNTGAVQIVVMDGATASTLSQILPLLLLTLMVELRRSALHQRISRLLFGVFFLVFGVIETVLVL